MKFPRKLENFLVSPPDLRYNRNLKRHNIRLLYCKLLLCHTALCQAYTAFGHCTPPSRTTKRRIVTVTSWCISHRLKVVSHQNQRVGRIPPCPGSPGWFEFGPSPNRTGDFHHIRLSIVFPNGQLAASSGNRWRLAYLRIYGSRGIVLPGFPGNSPALTGGFEKNYAY